MLLKIVFVNQNSPFYTSSSAPGPNLTKSMTLFEDLNFCWLLKMLEFGNVYELGYILYSPGLGPYADA